jgi:phosphatidylglycerol:prolipoprotein diacylglycerol transferase
MLDFYQHLPEHIDPVALSVGNFSLYWYGVTYLLSFVVGSWAFLRLSRKGDPGLPGEQATDLVLFLLIGMLVGARLGYVVLYNLPFYIEHPSAVISPFDVTTGRWIGISGMSYYGGAIGAVTVLWLFVRTYSIDFWALADRVALAAPVGYFFGRVGNFLNGELFGRITDKAWGMYFQNDGTGGTALRHPSQLYEAFFEGLVLFGVLWWLRGRAAFSGALALWYAIGYGFLRFAMEFFREPDPQVGLLAGLTLGQWLSLAVCMSGSLVFFWRRRRSCAIVEGRQ